MRLNRMILPKIARQQMKQLHLHRTKRKTGQTASISAVDVANQIDGHLSYFDVDSAALRTPTISGLLFVAEYLKANPDQRILVEGHCDERGTRDYNLALGEKRAEAIRAIGKTRR